METEYTFLYLGNACSFKCLKCEKTFFYAVVENSNAYFTCDCNKQFIIMNRHKNWVVDSVTSKTFEK